MANKPFFNMIKSNLDEYMAEFLANNPKLAKLCDTPIALPEIEGDKNVDENQ